ncbi:MAG: nitroreductase family protein [Pseudomonadota bacterium]
MSDHSPNYQPVSFAGLPAYDETERLARARAFRAMMARRRTIRDFSDKPVPRGVIEEALLTAGGAPSGANKQPWHFCVVEDPGLKRRVREAAEAEERTFYAGKAGQAWLADLAPLGTDPAKPFLETAPVLIVVFQESYGLDPVTGRRHKHYYLQESVGLACGFLLAALTNAGLATLTHTPSPMGFLRDLLGRPTREKPVMIVVTGHPAPGATVPKAALAKKPLEELASWF